MISLYLENTTSITIEDFANGESFAKNPSKEEGKTMMKLVLTNEIGVEKPPPRKDRSVQKEVKHRWPNEEVPCTIEAVFSTEEKAVIANVSFDIRE